MGLPEVIINFNSKASNVIERSGRGIVALVIQDSTKQIESAAYKGLEEVNKEDYTAENYDYISMIFKGSPNKVIVERASEVTDYTEVLQRLKSKIARGVNSLVTLTDDKSEDFKKIKIVEAMDLVKDDIRETFEDSYVGQVINDYDNKSLFLAAINSYFKELEGDNILDSNSENKADINVSAQKKYLIEKQVDVTNLNDQQVKEYNTGSKVFVTSSVKFVDAMEDLYFDINM